MLRKISLSFFVTIIVFFSSICHSSENSIDHPIIDSNMTLMEALEGLNSNCPEAIRNNQILIDVLYYSTDRMIHKGQLVIDKRLADDVMQVFKVAFENQFPLASVIPVSRFNWNDERSMEANNTSSFNYREVTGGKKLSNHSYGFAIDVNPLFNPYIKNEITLPISATYDPNEPGTLTDDHIIVKTFLSLGWEWGGNWNSLKDYQHFEKVIHE
jgi:peptidoglycan L-alanyl-D-glutamate endopeptidase CwlK